MVTQLWALQHQSNRNERSPYDITVPYNINQKKQLNVTITDTYHPFVCFIKASLLIKLEISLQSDHKVMNFKGVLELGLLSSS